MSTLAVITNDKWITNLRNNKKWFKMFGRKRNKLKQKIEDLEDKCDRNCKFSFSCLEVLRILGYDVVDNCFAHYVNYAQQDYELIKCTPTHQILKKKVKAKK